MVKLNKNRSENFLAFVCTRARSGSRPIIHFAADTVPVTAIYEHSQPCKNDRKTWVPWNWDEYWVPVETKLALKCRLISSQGLRKNIIISLYFHYH